MKRVFALLLASVLVMSVLTKNTAARCRMGQRCQSGSGMSGAHQSSAEHQGHQRGHHSQGISNRGGGTGIMSCGGGMMCSSG